MNQPAQKAAMKGAEKRNNTKCLAYVAVFAVFQTAIIVVISLTVTRIKSPKVWFGAISVENLSTSNTSTSPSFNMRLMTQLTVENTNFGHFKYGNNTMAVLYSGTPIGTAVFPRGQVKARQTKKVNITLDISSDLLSRDTNLGRDINSGVLTLTSQARLCGKVRLMKIINKRKTSQMNCTMAINLGTRVVGLSCQ